MAHGMIAIKADGQLKQCSDGGCDTQHREEPLPKIGSDDAFLENDPHHTGFDTRWLKSVSVVVTGKLHEWECKMDQLCVPFEALTNIAWF